VKIIRPTSAADFTLTTTNVPEAPPATYAGGTTYALSDLVSVYTGTTAQVYESLQNSNTGNTPASSPSFWNPIAITYAEYAGGTTYSLGDKVISTTTHHEYESLANSNLGNALTDATKWLDLGSNNRWRMFDQLNSSLTIRDEQIDVTVDINGRADGIAILNVLAATIQIIVTADAIEVYNETFDMVSDSGVDNWYEYFFEPIVRKSNLIVTDLPNVADPQIQIIIDNATGSTEVGTVVIGQSKDLGMTIYGARTGIQDYSRKTTDEFGNFTIVERAYAKRATFDVTVDNDKIDAISDLLALYRATPVVWVGTDDYNSTWIYGFYKDFSIAIKYVTQSNLALEIEGLT
jgi:hypothetical protein